MCDPNNPATVCEFKAKQAKSTTASLQRPRIATPVVLPWTKREKNDNAKCRSCSIRCNNKPSQTCAEPRHLAAYEKAAPSNRMRAKRGKLAKRFPGLSFSRYQILREECLQSTCKICGRQAEVIDHNHVTGELRGFLCSQCNKAIGLLQDNPSFFRTAAIYIETAQLDGPSRPKANDYGAHNGA